NDGAVEFNQGVEFYNAARRLGKEMVMLVYEGENHGLAEKPNQRDYQSRILQWFGHYLKGEPAPEGIEKGMGWWAVTDGVVRGRTVRCRPCGARRRVRDAAPAAARKRGAAPAAARPLRSRPVGFVPVTPPASLRRYARRKRRRSGGRATLPGGPRTDVTPPDAPAEIHGPPRRPSSR